MGYYREVIVIVAILSYLSRLSCATVIVIVIVPWNRAKRRHRGQLRSRAGSAAARMASESATFAEQTLQVGDLGRFSMRAIYDALAVSTQSATSLPTPRRSQHVDPEDSDCSWTQEDDNGTFYFDMQKRLSSFAATSNDQTNMTTAFLSKAQRRFVHATAQILRLGHASLGPPGKLRRMIVFKDTGEAAPIMSDVGRSSDSPQDASVRPSPSKKRRRLERIEKGFPCHFCSKVFDRASERRKHEQAHQPNLTSRFPCTVCGRAFRYPKDLRRHSKVHEKAQTAKDGTQSLSSSLDSGASAPPLLGSSTLTADSRVPSDTSLAFSSQCVSKNVSPTLIGQDGGQLAPLLDIEPFVLDESVWSVGADDWLFDPEVGFGDGGQDEDFLEMAKVRK